jgi:uncharacterized repeat protein (TIGR03803 family)
MRNRKNCGTVSFFSRICEANFSSAGRNLLALVFLSWLTAASQTASAQTFSVMYTFQGGSDGANPVAGLIIDSAGNLYGTTQHGGGTGGYGTVFRVSKKGTETLLHNFSFETPDGNHPVAGLTRDSKGNLYGATPYGAKPNAGVVFELTPTLAGPWTETLLYTFNDEADGGSPLGGVVLDPKGNLYGTTFATNGTSPRGVVFKLTLSPTPPWTETVLHSFEMEPDGLGPEAGLVRDAKGNLYGTTASGGHGEGYGVIFKVDNKNQETVLYTFTGFFPDGIAPAASLIGDAQGNLYGTAPAGGANQGGVVFELTPNPDGSWTETRIYNFCTLRNCADGDGPEAALVMDAQGNLYGTTEMGGVGGTIPGRDGVVFKLAPALPTWTETVLHSFTGGADGTNPIGGLVLDKLGNLYGTTSKGGKVSACSGPGCGTVFKITP